MLYDVLVNNFARQAKGCWLDTSQKRKSSLRFRAKKHPVVNPAKSKLPATVSHYGIGGVEVRGGEQIR